MRGTRVDRIEICDFLGFPADAVPPIELGGKNLLLYGENGSGKSTIFGALSQLLDIAEQQPFNNNLTDARCLKHRFSDPALVCGRVALHFTQMPGGAPVPPMTWSIGNPRPHDHELFLSMGRTRGFLDYRALLQTHFLHRDYKGINLFSLVVQGLLRDVEYPTATVTFGQEWEAIEERGRYWLGLAARDVGKMDDAEKIQYGLEPPDTDDGNSEGHIDFDEAAAFQRYVEAQRETVQIRIRSFNGALWQRVLEIQTLANAFIVGFDLRLAIDFDFRKQLAPPNASPPGEWPGEPELILRARFRNELIEHPGTFLNEARLTAIALAFYLAALKVEIPDAATETDRAPRLLVLDDVLIGLDLSNRQPVIDLVEREFVAKGWQVLLLTFDRAWYEVAKQSIRSGGWLHKELFAIRVGDFETPLLVADDDHLYRALAFLEAGEVKAAAVHVRTKFELVLKWACEELGLAVKYRNEPHKVSASELWAPVKGAIYKAIRPPQFFSDAAGRLRNWKQPAPVDAPVVPAPLAARIEIAVSWVLNPLSHSQTVDRYRREIEDAIFAVDELETAVSRALHPRNPALQVLRQMLADRLQQRVAKLPSAPVAPMLPP